MPPARARRVMRHQPPTVHASIEAAARRLAEAGIPVGEARLDASLLARHVLGWDAAALVANRREVAPASFGERYRAIVERRARREPVAYITGRCEFWGREFEVTPDVLIPRPETELIVEAVIDRFPPPGFPARIADVGTGSGCLAVTLATTFPEARLVATDISPGALAVARRNAERHGVSSRIAFREEDLLTGAASFDLIVSNPPYVDPADRAGLSPEVLHEPDVALFSPDAGLRHLSRLLRAGGHAAGAWLVVEIGFGQDDAVCRLLEAGEGWTEVRILPDLQGVPRVVCARRSPAEV
jgi:release factor glutamine methyltransferase